MRILKQSRSAEKLKKGDPLGFLKLQFAAIGKLEGGPFGDKKFHKKISDESRIVPKKSPIVSSVSYV